MEQLRTCTSAADPTISMLSYMLYHTHTQPRFLLIISTLRS